MKEAMEKIRGMKGGIFLIILCLCALLCLLAPLDGGKGGEDMTDEERRISRALSAIAGAGECRIILHYAGDDYSFGGKSAPAGAMILARGARDIGVRLQLMQAAEALLGLPPERVEIFPMEVSP